MLTEQDLQWFGTTLDHFGYIAVEPRPLQYISKHPGRAREYAVLRFQSSVKPRSEMERLRRVACASSVVEATAQGKPILRVTVCGKKAANALRAALPYMSNPEKILQASDAIAVEDDSARRRRDKRYRPDNTARKTESVHDDMLFD